MIDFVNMNVAIKQYYKTLDLSDDATISEVKQQFKKLALQYHPDKTIDSNNVNKFIEIHNAYKNILNYHNFMISQSNATNNNVSSIYDLFKPIVSNKMPFVNDFFKIIYDNETELRNDINNIDLIKIFDTIKNKFVFDDNNNSNQHNSSSKNANLQIYHAIDVSIKDRYLNTLQNIQIERKTRPLFECKIYPNYKIVNTNIDVYDNCQIIENEGEIDDDGNVGNITIFMNIISDDNFVLIGNDVYHKIKIDLYTFLYGGNVTIEYFDDDIEIQISSNGLINKSNHYVISNKGINNGNLIVSFEIANLMEIKEEIKKISKT